MHYSNNYIFLLQISKADVLSYDGVGKPPHCEIRIKAVSDAPSDFIATISFDERSSEPTTITRAFMGQLYIHTCVHQYTGSFCYAVTVFDHSNNNFTLRLVTVAYFYLFLFQYGNL